MPDLIVIPRAEHDALKAGVEDYRVRLQQSANACGALASDAMVLRTERDSAVARAEELEAQWVSVLLSVKSSLVPQSQSKHRSFRDGWMAAIDYALQLLDKEAQPNA